MTVFEVLEASDSRPGGYQRCNESCSDMVRQRQIQLGLTRVPFRFESL
jgi:hypothetical protein